MKENHPLTKFIPERADQGALSLDIAQSGVREPVILYEGKVLEGRVRYRACLEVDVQPQFKDWVLIAEGAPIDWMVRRHIEQHNPSELDLIKLVISVLPLYRKMRGSTHRKLYDASGLSWNKIRTLDWLEQAGKLDKVLSGEQGVFEAGRQYGFVPEKREVSAVAGTNFGQGDKFDEATQPLKRYLAAWGRKGYEFRHLNPKEASRRLKIIDQLSEGLAMARPDIEMRSHSIAYTAPPERKES
jgi:hypothetical protein